MCMKLKNKILVCVAVVCVAAGCNPAAQFEVLEAPMPELRGLASLHGTAVVRNEGGRSLTVENAVITVRYRDRELGRAHLMLPVEIPAGGDAEVRYDMALEGVTIASVNTLASRMNAVTVDIDGRVRWGRWHKKIELRDVEAARLIGIIF